MISKETIRLMFKYSDEILEVIDHRDEFTSGDLRGVIEAIVLNIVSETQ
jgi:hypothetical protein